MEIDSYYERDPLVFTSIWATTPLPSKMSEEVKLKVRAIQIKVLLKLSKNIDYVYNDFIKLIDANSDSSYIIYICAAALGLEKPQLSMELLYIALKSDADPSFEGSDLLPVDIITAIMVFNSAKIRDLIFLEMWFNNLKLLKQTQLQKLMEEEMTATSLFLSFEMLLAKALQSEDKELLHNTDVVFENIGYFAESNSWLFLYALTTRERLLIANIINSYRDALKMYEATIKKCADNELASYLLSSSMALLAKDNKEITQSIKLTEFALSRTADEEYLFIDKVNLCLANATMLADTSQTESIKQSRLALDLVKQNTDWELAHILKIYGEHLINAFLLGHTKTEIALYYEVGRLLIENDSFNGREEVIALWCHNIAYIAEFTVHGHEIKTLGDDPYTPPARGMFVNEKDATWFLENHNEGKLYFTLFHISEMLNYYDFTLEEKGLMQAAAIRFSMDKDADKHGSVLLMPIVSSYSWSRLIDINKETEALRLLLTAYKQTGLVILDDLVISHIYMMTVSFINRYYRENKDFSAEGLLRLVNEIKTFCMQLSHRLTTEFEQLLDKIMNQAISISDLVTIGNSYRNTDFEYLQGVAYLLYTLSPITQNTLQLQIYALQYMEQRVRGNNDAFYRIEYIQYLKYIWFDFIQYWPARNRYLITATQLLNENIPSDEDGLHRNKRILRAIQKGFNSKVDDKSEIWLCENGS